MFKRLISGAILLGCFGLSYAQDQRKLPDVPAAQQQQTIDIPYTKFTLKNGLTVLVHEDKKAPIVAVNIWYHVGSKNEKAGKTGFAHLFEHLMFNGSEHYNDDYFRVLNKLGATDLNGTTNNDRTNYFQNVHKNALETVLWMESDRMGHLLGAIDQAKLDEQRGVVQNEKRQGENQPYGKAFETILANTYPKNHPYSWTTIGSMDDLNAASLEDVKDWFRTYYGPNNATLVLAGDLTVEQAKQMAEKYFGDIQPGPPVARHDVWVAKMTGEHRMSMQDRVPQTRITKVWNVPQFGSEDLYRLQLASMVLGSGKSSRMTKRLTIDEPLATGVGVGIAEREIGSQFQINIMVRPGADPQKAEAAADAELAKFLESGPTEAELQRVKTQILSGLLRGTERIGGFGGKSDILAQFQVFNGSPEGYKNRIATIMNATPADVLQTAREWLSDGVFVLTISPYPQLSKSDVSADRTTLPVAGDPPASKFPVLQRTTLANGLNVILAERHDVPLVNFSLQVPSGYAADAGKILGTARLAMDMLDEGTTKRDALQISEEAALLGASIGTGAGIDFSSASLAALKMNLDKSLELFADVVLNPAFRQADFERLKRQQLASIQQEAFSPNTMAVRIFPRLLYGEGHPYAIPLTGSGTTASVNQLTPAALAEFHKTWFKPNNATMVVAGDITMPELKAKLETYFGAWQKGTVPTKAIPNAKLQAGTSVYIIDRPAADQSVIFAGHLIGAKSGASEIAIETMNTVLGGDFLARINMNLREDKHWSYGASSFIQDTKNQRFFTVVAPVQSDKTKEAMLEIKKELSQILSGKPISADELNTAKNTNTLSLPGRWETLAAVLGDAVDMAQYGLKDDFYQTYGANVNALSLDAVNAAAKNLLMPEKMIWVVVGDRAKIEAAVRELGFGEVNVVDTDLNPVK